MSPPVNLSSRLRTACAAVVAAAGFLAASPRASADSVNLKFDSTTSSSSVTVKIGTGSQISGIPGPYYWHEVNAPANSPFPNPTTTFCVELTQHISTGSSYTFSTSSLAAAPGISAAQATAISELYAGHYNTAWEKSGFAGSADSTAFQLALWAIVYDTNGNYKLTGTGAGTLKVISADSTALSTAQTWLNTLGSQPSFSSVFPNEQLVWLSNAYNQDQLTLIPCTPVTPPPPPPHGVPAPPGVLLGLIGLGGCLFGRGFRRRTATAVTA